MEKQQLNQQKLRARDVSASLHSPVSDGVGNEPTESEGSVETSACMVVCVEAKFGSKWPIFVRALCTPGCSLMTVQVQMP